MTTAVVIQARMSSSRLPGKIMLDAGGETFLAWAVKRCMAIPGADTVCVATTDGADCDPVAEEARRLGAEVFRGDERDVLGRYLGAAHAVGATTVMRVTSDCPLIDPNVCGAVLDLRQRTGADYASNNMPSSWPHGLDCEAFTTAALARAKDLAETTYDTEHVTPVLRSRPEFKTASLLGPGGAWERLRWTLDTADDLAFFQSLLPLLSGPGADLAEVLDCLDQHPALYRQCFKPAESARVDQQAAQVETATPDLLRPFQRPDMKTGT